MIAEDPADGTEELTLGIGTFESLGKELYRVMWTIRYFEELIEQAHMSGSLIGPFHSSLGQEAIAAGACGALRDGDVITSTHRGHGHLIGRGADLGKMCAELWGKETGYCSGHGGSMHLADLSLGILGQNGIVGASIFLAAGAALSFALRGEDRVAVAFTGDGALGQGVLYESLNLAAIWRLPLVIVIENNGYAHSMPAREAQKLDSIEARAASFGVRGLSINGLDATKVYSAVSSAAALARAGGGPTIVEAKCLRWKGHNFGDADALYRPNGEARSARKRGEDPIKYLEASLAPEVGRLELEEIRLTAKRSVEEGIAFAERSSPARELRQ